MPSPSDVIAVGSSKIFWERDGSSHGEKVVFVHALGCNLDLWDTIVPLTPAGFQRPALVLCGEVDVTTPPQLGYFCGLRPDMGSSVLCRKQYIPRRCQRLRYLD